MVELAVEPDRFVELAVTASAGRSAAPTSGVVALRVDGAEIGLEIVDGRVVGPGAVGEAGVAVPLTGGQLRAIVEGSLSLAQAFMKGDVKPEGATGPLLALIELFEDEEFRLGLAPVL